MSQSWEHVFCVESLHKCDEFEVVNLNFNGMNQTASQCSGPRQELEGGFQNCIVMKPL
jgi:hypothetical protein